MKNKLHLVQRTVCLTCAWVATGDARTPLVRVWSTVGTPSVTVNSEEVRMHLCA